MPEEDHPRDKNGKSRTILEVKWYKNNGVVSGRYGTCVPVMTLSYDFDAYDSEGPS